MNFLIKKLIQPYGLGFNPSFFFSISKQQFIDKHEAILASKIIQKIIKQPVTQKKLDATEKNENQNSVLPSLRSEVIKMIKDYSIDHGDKSAIYEISPQNEAKDSLETAKKNMLKYFDGGVFVDGNLCIQPRFISEEIKQDQNNKDNQVENNLQSTQNSLDDKKLTFCPTYLVTGQIFRTVLLKQKFLLITGHFGIGKTYSFMLYHLLSDFIYRYLHKYCKQGKLIPEGINTNFPKLVYWNIDIDQIGEPEGQDTINEIIAKQCYELTDDIEPKYQFFQLYKSSLHLKKFYLKKNIRIRLIIDQINVISSAFRNKNTLVQLNDQYRKKLQDIKLEADKDPSKKYQLVRQKEDIITNFFGSEQQIQRRFTLAQLLRRMVRDLRINFGRAFFLSSRDIEKSLMQRLDLNGRDSHIRISEKHIKYEQLSQTPQNLSDASQLFVFLLMIKFKQLNKQNFTEKHNQIITKIKQIVLKRFKKQRLLLLPFTVGSAIFSQQKGNLQETISKILNKDLSQKQLQEKIDQIIFIINKKYKAQLSEHINVFLNI